MPPPRRDEDIVWDDPEDADESWRGDEHIEDWPESLAGPEYWLYKEENNRDTEDE
jgi:hypothetical protein